MFNSFNCEKCKHIKVCKFKEMNENIVKQLRNTAICVEKNTTQNASDIKSTLIMGCIHYQDI